MLLINLDLEGLSLENIDFGFKDSSLDDLAIKMEEAESPTGQTPEDRFGQMNQCCIDDDLRVSKLDVEKSMPFQTKVDTSIDV